MAKLVWLVLGKDGLDPGEFRELLLRDAGKVAQRLLPTTAEAVVTPQEPEQFSSATVDPGNGDRPFDAAIEVTTADDWPLLDPFQGYLGSISRYIAGWRVHPTVITDGRSPQARGERSELPTLYIFIERRDGVTPEFFSHNWYIHAGHPDGREVENDEARAKRRVAESSPGALYVQNRVLESIGPTPWVTHGFTKLAMPDFVPAEGYDDPDTRERMRRPGEAPFDRWPARILQGYACQVV
jgi:hypothetical protein